MGQDGRILILKHMFNCPPPVLTVLLLSWFQFHAVLLLKTLTSDSDELSPLDLSLVCKTRTEH